MKKKKFGDNKDIAETLKRVNSLLLSESYFRFNGNFYKQKKGLPMGSPISSILADIKMNIIDSTIRKSFQNEIKHWYRYVDDVFAVLEEKQEPRTILEEINKIDPNIKFTIEEENEGSLNFLDVKISRKGKEISTTVYRKPTAANQFVSAKSHTPFNFKISAMRSYINRALCICSNEALLKEEFSLIKMTARKAGFNETTINKIFNERIKKIDRISPGQPEKRKFTNAIPYNKGTAIKIMRKAKEKGLIIPIKPSKNIFQRIRSDKEKIEEKETAGVYSIQCKDSSGKIEVYIGVTKRKIRERLKEHQADIKFGRIGTALAIKNSEEEIEVDFQSAKKLANYEGHGYAFKRESVEIACAPNAINAIEHARLNKRWRSILKGFFGQSEKGAKRQADEGPKESSGNENNNEISN